MVLSADGNRRVRAEKKLKQWSLLLAQLVTSPPVGKTARPEAALSFSKS